MQGGREGGDRVKVSETDEKGTTNREDIKAR